MFLNEISNDNNLIIRYFYFFLFPEKIFYPTENYYIFLK